MQSQNGKERILFIDIARFLGIFLVFYGHFVERVMYLRNPAAEAQYKFIYSFHLVVFFIIAGYVSDQKGNSFQFGKFLKYRLASRLLPYFFFTALFMVMAAIFPGDFVGLKLPTVHGYLWGLHNTLWGFPLFCIPSWFILIIFSVEMVHYIASRGLKSNTGIIVGIVVFYIVGFLFNQKFDIIDPMRGRTIGWNYLYINEAVFMYAFYLIGVYFRRKRFLIDVKRPYLQFPVAVIFFVIVLFTYRLNRGYFSFPNIDAVLILLSSHGHYLWFPLTAMAGSMMILCFARAIPPLRVITWMGQNTLVLMCLNGIFYHFINQPAARWIVNHISGTPPTVLLSSTAVTVISLLFCIPLLYILNRFIPQLVGKPKLRGPLLRNLI